MVTGAAHSAADHPKSIAAAGRSRKTAGSGEQIAYRIPIHLLRHGFGAGCPGVVIDAELRPEVGRVGQDAGIHLDTRAIGDSDQPVEHGDGSRRLVERISSEHRLEFGSGGREVAIQLLSGGGESQQSLARRDAGIAVVAWVECGGEVDVESELIAARTEQRGM